jgi:hypothetical protein
VAAWHGRVVEFDSHVGNRRIKGANAIGKARTDGKLAAIDRGIGAAHCLRGQTAVGGDQAAEFGVQPIDIDLNGGAGALGQRLSWWHRPWTFGKAFRIVFIVMAVFGISGAGLSALKFLCILTW